VKFMIIAVVLGLMPGVANDATAKPLKVFVLAGQPNRQGHAVRQPVSGWPRLLKNTSSQGPITITSLPP
jgi:hypothetical protein